jgi:AraC-like DNA-binding protein
VFLQVPDQRESAGKIKGSKLIKLYKCEFAERRLKIMKSSDRPYGGHLNIRQFSVPPGGEWVLPLTEWSGIRIGKGAGYYMQQQVNQELDTGSVILIPPGVKGSIRASQLGELSSYAFGVTPARLTGLITLAEQRQLEVAASKEENAVQIFPPTSQAAAKMEELHACKRQDGFLFRLKLLQFFVELVEPELEQTMPERDTSDAKKRLQLFLKETSSSELLEMNFNELAQRARCTSRHLGRIFQELVGMSFRDKRAEIRLKRAQELLATTDCKIVDVAMESGFKSLSLFNLMFARQFGISPGRWRQKQGVPAEVEVPEKAKGFSLANGLPLSPKATSLARSDQSDEKASGKKSRNQINRTEMTKGFNRLLNTP